MTLIGATKIKGDKRALFSDDCITFGQTQINAVTRYRPKLRKITGKDVELIVASCGTTKDIDFVLNVLEAKLLTKKVKDTLALGILIQDVLLECMKSLKEVASEPQFGFLILHPETNCLWATDDYSMFLVQDYTQIVLGSGEHEFHNLYKLPERGFVKAFCLAVEANEYCGYPIYVYHHGKVEPFFEEDAPEIIETILYSNVDENAGEEGGKDSDISSGSGCNSKKTTKPRKNTRNTNK